MKIIPREAKRITYSTEIRNLKKRLYFNEDQKAIIIGSILGDGNLELNWSKTNYRLRVSHSNKQIDYLMWKYNILKKWVLTEPKKYIPTNSISFSTISHNEITNFGNLFYKKSKKIIPESIEKLIDNPLVLAIWYMDDGNIIKRGDKVYGYHLNTQSFTKEENLKLIAALKNIYNINASIELNKGKHRIRFMQKDSRNTFTAVIKGKIIPSMQYKLG